MGALHEQFAERLFQRLQELDWGPAHLANQMDLPPALVQEYLYGDRPASLSVWQRFAHALSVDYVVQLTPRNVKPRDTGLEIA